MPMLRSVQIAIIFGAGCELQHRFASREEKKIRDMAETYFRILDEDLEDDMCKTQQVSGRLYLRNSGTERRGLTSASRIAVIVLA